MSLINSLFSGVSGLRNHQTMMDTIGSNIANVNSIGYKSSRVTFSDTFNQFVRFGSDPTSTGGGTNTFQVGLGMKINAIDRNWNQGTFERTGITTDLALQGKSVFVLKTNGETMYSRAGNFAFDAAGNLVNTNNGGVVQGKLATDEGEVPAGNNLEDIKLDMGKRLPAVATSEIDWAGNLDSGSSITRSEVLEHTGNISSTVDHAAAPPANRIDLPSRKIYNEFGDAYSLNATYTKTAANAWTLSYTLTRDSDGVVVTPAAPANQVAITFNGGTGALATVGGAAATPDNSRLNIAIAGENINSRIDFRTLTQTAAVTSATGVVDTNRVPTIVEGTLSIFDSLGKNHTLTVRYTKIDSNRWAYRFNMPPSSGTLQQDPQNQFIIFSPDGSVDQVNPTQQPIIRFIPQGGASEQNIQMNFGTTFDGITQTAQNSVVSAIKQNGSDSAVLTDFSIDQFGFITGVFSNGQSRKLAQLLLAKFANNGGLVSVGDNMYTVSANSGTPVIGEPGEFTGTTIQSGALEQSNVDLSEEFTRMIVAQRGFQANARVVTSSDTLLQEITNLVR